MFAKSFRAGLAGLLLLALLMLGGLGAANWSTNTGGLATLLQPAIGAGAPSAQPVSTGVLDRAGVTNAVSNSSGTAQVQGAGILDARPAVRKAGPAVVTVINTLSSQPGSGGQRAPQASGSGVIIDSNGHIVTNEHVVANGGNLQVIFSDGTKAPAKLIGSDSFADIAVLKVDTQMPAIGSFADSDTLEPGQPVVAIGSALGDYANTVTVGVISGLNRKIADAQSSSLRGLIQTDAAINHGNSGGPLLNTNGEIVGINVAVVRGGGLTGDTAEGLGFAIPSNTARDVAQKLIQEGKIERPYMGISYDEITPGKAAALELPRETGVLVVEVVKGGPAEAAGMAARTLIVAFDGTKLDEKTGMLELLMKKKAGDTVTLTVIKPGQTAETQVKLKLGARPQTP